MIPRPSHIEPSRVETPTQPARAWLSWRVQLLVFCLAFLAVVSRRPDAILNPQFFAEDGSVWYTNAYDWGWWHSLLLPQNGFYQTLPRLAAALALLVPLQFAPLIMNLVGMTVQVLPVNILLSSRCSGWGSLRTRALFALAYLALPNSYELNATVEEAQWHLALLACLLVLSSVPSNTAWRIFDLCILVLSGITGPFCLVLAPLAIVFWRIRREAWRAIAAIALIIPASVQIIALYQTAHATRPRVGLGASVPNFIRILAGQIYLGALVGHNHFAIRGNIFLLLIVAIACTAILIYCFIHAQLELRLFLIFAITVFAMSLRSPMVSMDRPQWEILKLTEGTRYWFFPMVAFAWSVIWCATSGPSSPWRLTGMALLLIMSLGAARDWRYPRYTDHNFKNYARQFEGAAPTGSLHVIPIYPDGWFLRLSKKGPQCVTMPVGTIDAPPMNAKVSGNVVVTGWVLSPERLNQVSIVIDKLRLSTVSPSVPRPDVDIVYPQAPDKNKGFSAPVDTSHLSPGKHALQVWTLDARGCEAEIAESSIERGP